MRKACLHGRRIWLTDIDGLCHLPCDISSWNRYYIGYSSVGTVIKRFMDVDGRIGRPVALPHRWYGS